jgi:predicted metal-dependent hydrolase
VTATIAPRRIQTRRIEFAYDETLPKHFVGGDPAMSHVVAVLSSLFPEGEDFFVESVRDVRDRITDPELKKQVSGFIGQEAIHGREHRTFNERLATLGYPTRFIDRLVKYGFRWFLGHALPKAHRLAVTSALEHYTATLAEVLLGDPDANAKLTEPEVRSLFLWHAVEESEHKSVAFDVFQSVSGKHRIRAGVMNVTTLGFLVGATAGTVLSLLLDGHTYRHPITTARSVARLRHSPWLRKDVRRRIRDYNRRDFHPEDHDATELLAEWRDRLFGESGTLTPRLKGRAATA